jgi:transposase
MISSGPTLAEDIRYALIANKGLTHFLEDGHLEPDTKPVVNAIRPVCLTKTMRSSSVPARVCRHHLQAQRRHRLHRRNNPYSRIEDLMPWRFRKTSSEHQ